MLNMNEDNLMYQNLNRRAFLGTSGAAVGSLAIGALPTRLMAQSPVTFQLSWLHSSQFAGSYIAQNRGWWAEEGLDVALSQGGPNAPVEPPVVSGQALLGIS